MATRTFRGTIDDSWDNADNWLEGSVPGTGDDVIFDSASGNCTLYSDVVFSSRLRSVNMAGYTGTFNFNGHKLSVGTGYVAGNLLIIDSTCTIVGTGEIELFSTGTATSGYNIIQLNNTGLSGVDVRFLGNNYNRSFVVLGPSVYMHSLIVPYYNVLLYGTTQSSPNGMHIYGDILILNDNPTYFGIIRLQFPGTQILTLHGNGIIKMNNSILYSYFGNINIEGNYTCIGDFKLFLIYYPCTINITGSLNTIGVLTLVSTLLASSTRTINLNLGNIKKLRLYNMGDKMSFRLLSDLTVTERFIVESFNDKSMELDGQNHNITLGSGCKHLLVSATFKNVSFNRKIGAFYCVMNNVTNMVNIEHPYTSVSSF